MDRSSPHTSEPGSRPARARSLPARRRPLRARKRLEREAARRRIDARPQRRLTAAQLAFDPLGRPSARRSRRRWLFMAALLGSLAAHVVAVAIGLGWSTRFATPPRREEVKIEMRERPPAPPKELPPPPPPPEKPARSPKISKAPPPPLPVPPPAAPKPVRIVGLSLESTTEGGSGPAFAVGNTRQGETADRAVAPKDVTPPPGNTAAPTNAPGSGRGNQVASRIPVAGVVYELPKRRNPATKPHYPPTLKSQGIEGDVTVMVNVAVDGKVSVKVIAASPYPEFDAAAREAALADAYDPGTRNGVPIPRSLTFTYRFRLDDQ